jgi:carboxypeptidase Q
MSISFGRAPSIPLLFGAIVFCVSPAHGTGPADSSASVLGRLCNEGLRSTGSYRLLEELVNSCGSRLSGSAGAQRAIRWAKERFAQEGFADVRVESVMVPHWVRGPIERCSVVFPSGRSLPLSVAALGGSIATPRQGISAGVIEVHSIDELRRRRDEARGKIVFFNRPLDPTLLDTFDAYGGAVDQRSRGALEAGRAGGVAALVRSMTLRPDDVPHTGGMSYADSVRKVPGAALSIRAADRLSEILRKNPGARVRLTLSCRILPDAPSANVMGELRGWEHPDEVIVVGGHLDSWDKGVGAHDDGAGCVQAIEALRLLKSLGITPRRTIRAVMFMNEENGLRGGKGYAADSSRKGERHIALLESDRGGFCPRGFTIQADSGTVERAKRWAPLFAPIGADSFTAGHSGADISPLVNSGIPGFALYPENQRYFDYHHSASDTVDKVNPRELELGAIAEAYLCYLLSEKGL